MAPCKEWRFISKKCTTDFDVRDNNRGYIESDQSFVQLLFY